MKYSYRLHATAEQEYLESYLWYEQQQEGLGERFATVVRSRLNNIASNPEQYGKKKGHFREVALNKPFPFVIVYVVEKKSRLLVITSIFHTSRNPRHKYRR